MKNVIFATSLLLACGTATLIAVEPPITDSVDTTVSKSKTLTWQDERELLVMLESTSNRVLLADQIVDTCLTSTTLTPSQKYDGYRVAGTALFTDFEYAKAASAFNHAVNETTLDVEKAEVTASAAEAYHKLGQTTLSRTKYVDAVNYYLTADPGAVKALHAEATFRRLVTISLDLGLHSESLMHAQQAIAFSDTLVGASLDKAYYRFTAAKSAFLLSDHASARQLYSDFLAQHPNYLDDQPNLGLVPQAKINHVLSNNANWDSPNQELVECVLEILANPNYAKMPIRINLAEKLAYAWVQKHNHGPAKLLRNDVADSTIATLDSMDATNQSDLFLGRRLWKQMAISQLNSATTSYYYTGDLVAAQSSLARVLEPSSFSEQRLVDDAQALMTKISNQP